MILITVLAYFLLGSKNIFYWTFSKKDKNYSNTFFCNKNALVDFLILLVATFDSALPILLLLFTHHKSFAKTEGKDIAADLDVTYYDDATSVSDLVSELPIQ